MTPCPDKMPNRIRPGYNQPMSYGDRKMTPAPAALADLEIVEYTNRHSEAFRDLNLDWIQEYFSVEPLDRRYLLAPEEEILAPGGAIFMAELSGVAVGCCALLNHGGDVYEVSKMAVDKGCRGLGIGRRLFAEVLERSRDLGARKLTIVSNTTLAPALHLYRSFGFHEVPLQNDDYARGDIALELIL